MDLLDGSEAKPTDPSHEAIPLGESLHTVASAFGAADVEDPAGLALRSPQRVYLEHGLQPRGRFALELHLDRHYNAVDRPK